MNAPRPERLAFGVEPSDRRFRLRLARYPALASRVAKHCLARDGRSRVLDVGCGRGRLLRYLEPTGAADRARLVGIDLDPRLRERIHRIEKWDALLADASRGLPFRDASFDVVVCEQVLEHIEEPARLVAEAARVLVDRGLLVLGVPTFPPGIAQLRRVVGGDRDDATHGHGHVQSFDARSARRVVERSGAFDVEDVRGFRSASGGLLGPLEDAEWWWRLNGAVFGTLTWFAAEVQISATRRSR